MAKEDKFYKGKLLISNSSVVTDYFNKTVILMIEHDKNGGFGIVLNKNSTHSVAELIKGLPEGSSKDVPVYSGGPVDPTFVSILHDNAEFEEPGMEILSGIYLGRSLDLLTHLLESNSRFHVFQGYSGWGPFQLEAEYEKKSWVIHEPKAEFIFNEDPENVWREALKSKGGIYKYFAEHTKDPMLN